MPTAKATVADVRLKTVWRRPANRRASVRLGRADEKIGLGAFVTCYWA